MYAWCVVTGPSLTIRPFAVEDVDALTEIQQYNRTSFSPFMPVRSDTFYTKEAQEAQIARDQMMWQADLGYAFAIEEQGLLAGRVALSNVVRGAWQNATLGYWVDSRRQGRGLATAAVQAVLAAAFEHLGLHRVQAAIMPHNAPSLAVVRRIGFCEEGLAPRYLHIDGQWQDHRIFSLTLEDYSRPAGFALAVQPNP